jgi:hypothetical protein
VTMVGVAGIADLIPSTVDVPRAGDSGRSSIQAAPRIIADVGALLSPFGICVALTWPAGSHRCRSVCAQRTPWALSMTSAARRQNVVCSNLQQVAWPRAHARTMPTTKGLRQPVVDNSRVLGQGRKIPLLATLALWFAIEAQNLQEVIGFRIKWPLLVSSFESGA